MTKTEWLMEEQRLQAAAWKELRDLTSGEWTASNAGYRSLADIAKRIKQQNSAIYETIGDCPTTESQK